MKKEGGVREGDNREREREREERGKERQDANLQIPQGLTDGVGTSLITIKIQESATRRSVIASTSARRRWTKTHLETAMATNFLLLSL
jgi:hypothetical protein